jgi:glycosyltransferase involved in cell wall biosynthesis
MIRPQGGWKSTFNRAIGVYRREGLGSAINRILIWARTRRVNPVSGSGEYDRNDYAQWIERFDTPDEQARHAIAARIDTFAERPLISIVMPTYNPNAAWLIEVIESVRSQSYPHWELCIADDASTNAAIRPILERFATEDHRIKVVFRQQNGHISEASNSAVEIVSGSWIALLDHDDLLNEQALFRVADVINRHHDARMIYSDEDKVDEAGNRFEPYFKCDWNLDLFYSQNLFSHLGVYRTDLVRAVGGFRKGLEGSQDYDLALRCIEQINSDQIHHIPHVLYHWRVHAESTARSGDAKPYAVVAGERALNEHFVRRGVAARAEVSAYGYRVHYALPASPPRVSIIIRVGRDLPALHRSIATILEKTAYPDYEILLLAIEGDCASAELAADTRVRVLPIEPGPGQAAATNIAVRQATGEVVALLDNAIEVISPDWLSEMVSLALQSGIGAVGARLWYCAGMLNHGGIFLGMGQFHVAGFAHHRLARHGHGYFGRARLASSFSAVSDSCLVIRAAVFSEVGGLNEIDLQSAFNDVDFCLRVRACGYRNVWTPYAELKCDVPVLPNAQFLAEKHAGLNGDVRYMQEHWGTLLSSDPAYSPNLTRHDGDFSLAWPPQHVRIMEL